MVQILRQRKIHNLYKYKKYKNKHITFFVSIFHSLAIEEKHTHYGAMEADQLNEAQHELESGPSKNLNTTERETSFDQIFSIVPHYSFHQFLITMFGFYIGIIAGEVQVASVFFQV